MEDIAIVLSTYNGAQYLREQLDSLQSQTYKNIKVYIHDDGSKDETIDIINEYVRKSTPECSFILFDNQSMGYPQCFIHTLLSIPRADYYAFCDQDDIWNESKIEDGIRALKALGSNDRASLYYAAVDYYDGNMNYIRGARFVNNNKPVTSTYSLQELLLGGEAMGMTFVFNNKVRDVFSEIVSNGYLDFKDTFIKLYCAACGLVIYSYKPCAKYRRHSNATTVGMNPASNIQRIINMSKKIFIEKDGMESIQTSIDYIGKIYGDRLNNCSKKIVEVFSKPNSFRKRIQKVFWTRRFRIRFLDEIGYRIAFAIGRI